MELTHSISELIYAICLHKNKNVLDNKLCRLSLVNMVAQNGFTLCPNMEL